ncbi:MAG: M4 family metallopeptidase [Sphingobacteriia bacterium]
MFCLSGSALASLPVQPDSIQQRAEAYALALQQRLALSEPPRFFAHRASPGGEHFSFQQVHRGIPILDAWIKLNLNKAGREVSIGGQWHAALAEAEAEPDWSLGFVLTAKALDAYGGKLYREGPVWRYQEGQLVPAWEVITYEEAAEGGSHASYWDVQSQTLLEERDRGLDKLDTTATAWVYLPNPMTRARLAYGAYPEYRDNLDATNDSLNKQRSLVTLKGLAYENGLFRLKGPYVEIADLGGPLSAPVTSTINSFLYNRSQQGFEQVNAYYHVDTLQRWVQQLGFTNLFNAPLRIDPQGQGGDNSTFFPVGLNSYISFGTGGVDDAEDADVIIHEYTHALSEMADPTGVSANNVDRGLEEGIADYLCASYSRSLSNFGWQSVFDWDGHNPFWDGRTVATTQTYPTAIGKSPVNFYDIGEVWASALMKVWTTHGREKTDALVLQTLYLNTNSLTIEQAVENLLDADEMLFDGELNQSIRAALCSYQVTTGTLCAGVSRSKLSTADIDLRAFPSPFTDELSLEGEGSYIVFNSMGNPVSSGSVHSSRLRLATQSWAPGLYSVQLKNDRGQAKTIKMIKH